MMALSKEEIDALIKSVSLTRSEEATCDECLKDVAEFAEHALNGKSIPEGLQAVEHHLANCGMPGGVRGTAHGIEDNEVIFVRIAS